MFPRRVCPTHPSSIWSYACPSCAVDDCALAMATSRQETIMSIKLAILPARMLHATSCHTPMSALTTSTTVLQQPQDESLFLLLPGKAVAIYAFVSFSR